jgi:hypothetical protein
MIGEIKKILILCKTYPSPSAKYAETSCVAGMDSEGRLIRIFPVPFRLLEGQQQFKKWQWISARVRKARDDHRPESHAISVDTIETLGSPISTKNEWKERREAIKALPVFDDYAALEQARLDSNITLGLLKPSRLNGLQVTKIATPEWTEDELAKLEQEHTQAGLFEASDKAALATLRKLPYDFHYHYTCGIGEAAKNYKNKLVDWEAGALYWNLQHDADWESKFKQKFLVEFAEKDLVFLMGTIHRFPDQWLIISVFYFPRAEHVVDNQVELF